MVNHDTHICCLSTSVYVVMDKSFGVLLLVFHPLPLWLVIRTLATKLGGDSAIENGVDEVCCFRKLGLPVCLPARDL